VSTSLEGEAWPMLAIAPPRELNEETGKWEGTHSIAVGQTGFGKTFWGLACARTREFVIAHDPKGTMAEKKSLPKKEWLRCTTARQVVRAGDKGQKRIIYSPDRAELHDMETQANLCEFVYRRGNTFFLLDELTQLCDKREPLPPLRDCLTAGRERGIEIFACTQEPVFIPNKFLTQSRSTYVFFMSHDDHRQKVSGFVPVTREQIASLQKKQFYTYRNTWRGALGPLEYDPNLQEVFKVESLAA